MYCLHQQVPSKFSLHQLKVGANLNLWDHLHVEWSFGISSIKSNYRRSDILAIF